MITWKPVPEKERIENLRQFRAAETGVTNKTSNNILNSVAETGIDKRKAEIKKSVSEEISADIDKALFSLALFTNDAKRNCFNYNIWCHLEKFFYCAYTSKEECDLPGYKLTKISAQSFKKIVKDKFKKDTFWDCLKVIRSLPGVFHEEKRDVRDGRKKWHWLWVPNHIAQLIPVVMAKKSKAGTLEFCRSIKWKIRRGPKDRRVASIEGYKDILSKEEAKEAKIPYSRPSLPFPKKEIKIGYARKQVFPLIQKFLDFFKKKGKQVPSILKQTHLDIAFMLFKRGVSAYDIAHIFSDFKEKDLNTAARNVGMVSVKVRNWGGFFRSACAKAKKFRNWIPEHERNRRLQSNALVSWFTKWINKFKAPSWLHRVKIHTIAWLQKTFTDSEIVTALKFDMQKTNVAYPDSILRYFCEKARERAAQPKAASAKAAQPKAA